MEFLKSLVPLIIGLLFLIFFTTLISQSFHDKHEDDSVFSGLLFEQPVTDGRYKSINIEGRRVYMSRYFLLNQGDYVSIDFSACKYNEEFDSYDNCEIKIDKAKESKLLKYILNLRTTIISNAKQRLPSPHDVLVLAMTIGYEDDLPETLTEKLRDIGAIHMLVVSGYNVSLVLNSSAILLARFSRSIYITSSILLLLLFILLTGFDAPIVRSVVMGTFVVFSKAYSRPTAALYPLFLSAIVMLSWDLSYLSSISFQLSFAATFGVVISGYIFKSQASLLSDLGSSVGASIFVLPIISFYFGTLSFLGIASSILLGWAVPLITYLGFLIYLVNIQLVNLIFVVVVDVFLKICDAISYFSFLNLQYKVSLQGLVLYYISVLILVMVVYQIKEKTSYEKE